jgi:DNA-binding NarL/FixJ family response regulator
MNDDHTSQRPARVLLADDHHLFRQALSAAMSADERLDVVGSAASGAEAVELAAELEPDVVVVDLAMPVLDGVEATKQMRTEKPDLAVIVLSGSTDPDSKQTAMGAGATAYVRKDGDLGELIDLVVALSSLNPHEPA